MRFGLSLVGHGRVISGHVFAVQMFDFEDVDGNPATVTSTGPLGVLRHSLADITNQPAGSHATYHPPGGIIRLHIDILI